MAGPNDIIKQVQDPDLKWYVLSVNSGQEDSALENLKERVTKLGLNDDITSFYLPVVNEIITRKGKKTIKQVKMNPGYLYIKMRMNEKIWYVVSNTPGVRLIVGAGTTPIPLTDEEFNSIRKQVDERNSKISTRTSVKIGDIVILDDTNFKDMKGVVREVDELKAYAIVMVDFLGRATPVNIGLDKIQLA